MFEEAQIGIQQQSVFLEPIAINRRGGENNVYRMETGGMRYVVKELLMDSTTYMKLQYDPENIVGWMQDAYTIAKRYYGDSLADSAYCLGPNANGEQTIYTIQLEHEGQNLEEIVKESKGEFAPTAKQICSEFIRVWQDVIQDPDWNTLPNRRKQYAREFFMSIDIKPSQILLTPESRAILVDF